MLVEFGYESAGSIQRDAVRRELRGRVPGSADLGSVFLLHARCTWRDGYKRGGNERDLPGCGESSKPDHGRIEPVGARAGEAVDVSAAGCGGELHIGERGEEIPGVRGRNGRNESEPDDIASGSARRMSAG